MTYPEILSPEEKLAHGKKRLGIPTITVICGSTRFMGAMADADRELTWAGHIVIKPGCDMKTPHPLWADEADAEAGKERLDDLHKAKIRLADEVFVVGDYVGSSTLVEIAYARELGKPVRFTHPEVDPDGERREPCGESGCICYGVGEEHADCACGCDCPICDLCRQAPEDCECEE